MPQTYSNLYDQTKPFWWFDSKFPKQSELRCINYSKRDYKAFSKNRTGSWGLPSVYIETLLITLTVDWHLKPCNCHFYPLILEILTRIAWNDKEGVFSGPYFTVLNIIKKSIKIVKINSKLIHSFCINYKMKDNLFCKTNMLTKFTFTFKA